MLRLIEDSDNLWSVQLEVDTVEADRQREETPKTDQKQNGEQWSHSIKLPVAIEEIEWIELPDAINAK